MSFSPGTTVGIVGTGTMGQGIAQACASSGFRVLLYDVNDEIVARGLGQIRKSLDILLEKGKITVDAKDVALKNVQPSTDFSILKAGLIIEAAVEDLQVKKKIFADLEKQNDRETILLTNTSSISITQIGKDLLHPGRFAGMHFFNPVGVMKLVEIIQGASTTTQTVEKIIAFTKQLNKQPVIAQDSPGFIVNRVARHFYVEALKALEEGVSDVDD